MIEDAGQELCFVICPIGGDGSPERKHSDLVFTHIVSLAAQDCGYVAQRTIDQDRPGVISSDIITNIVKAPMVIADLTFQNPNVFYELAIRHAFGKPCVLLCEKDTKIPFDVSHNQVIRFTLDLEGARTAKDRLARQIRFAEKDPRASDNLVTNAVTIEALKRGLEPQDRRDALILERLESLSLDVQGLADEIRNPSEGHYLLSTTGTGDHKSTTVSLEDSELPEVPAFTRWFAEEYPGFFVNLLKENELVPRRVPLKEFWETEKGQRLLQQELDSENQGAG